MRPWVRGSIPLLAAVCALLGCAPQPTLVECEAGEEACASGCAELATDVENCGVCDNACEPGGACIAGRCEGGGAACVVNNGGCSPDALCMEVGGQPVCLCLPGFTGTGQQCTACTTCDGSQFVASPCTPVADTVCATCAPACESGMFEAQACGPQGDRVCTLCSACGVGQFEVAPCGGSQDTACAPCAVGCLACTGPGALCTACDNGFTLELGMCVPVQAAVCSNGIIEAGEQCDDANPNSGDGCSSVCQVEASFYCFAEPSFCRAGGCVFEAATALPLGPAFTIEGSGTASAAGVTFSQRSLIRTTGTVNYPVLVEADVIYSGDDITFIGARGPGVRDAGNNDEPTQSLRGRLTRSASPQLQLFAGDAPIASTAVPFTPSVGTPYRVRYVDDGFLAVVEWINLTNPAEGIGINEVSSFHGSIDRAFVGGGDQGGLTVSNIRVCEAPPLPVTTGLAARYSAIPSWTALRDLAGVVNTWQDISGNNRDLSDGGTGPAFLPGSLGPHAALDFAGAAQLTSSPFPLTTDVTVFAVIRHEVPGMWGAIAHHGSRDNDWSMEQSGFSGSSNVMHFQTLNDNTNVEQTLVQGQSYILTGRIQGANRSFSATAFAGSSPTPASFVDTGQSITVGDKPLFVGSSDASEPSNAVIGELVYFARALNDVERDAVIDYLKAMWRP